MNPYEARPVCDGCRAVKASYLYSPTNLLLGSQYYCTGCMSRSPDFTRKLLGSKHLNTKPIDASELTLTQTLEILGLVWQFTGDYVKRPVFKPMTFLASYDEDIDAHETVKTTNHKVYKVSAYNLAGNGSTVEQFRGDAREVWKLLRENNLIQ